MTSTTAPNAISFERWGSDDVPRAAAGTTGANGQVASPSIAFERWGDAAPQPSMAEDIAKSGGAGLVKGAAGLVGLPGDIQSLGKTYNPFDWLAEKYAQADPEQAARNRALADKLGRASDIGEINLPTTADAQKAITDNVTGQLHEPETTAGKYAQTIGEFAPAALGGPESLGARLLRMVTPAVASEAAGQATQGTALEPVARVAGALAGGKIGSVATKPKLLPVPTIDELKDAARAGYQSPDVAAVEIHPQAVSNLAAKIENDLVTSGFRPTSKSAADTFAEVRGLNVPQGVSSVKVADIDNARRALGNLSKEVDAVGRPTTEAAAASRAIGHLDDFLPNLNQSDLLAGDAQRANAILNEARGNWGAAKRSELINNKAERADLNAAVANSGANIDNATRQQIKSLLLNKQQLSGFSPAEVLQLHQIARGTMPANISRAVGNLLGGGGGLGALHAMTVGDLAAGPAGLAAPAVGYLAKKLGNASTARGVTALDQATRARSPLYAAAAAAAPPPAQPNQFTRRLMEAALAGPGSEEHDRFARHMTTGMPPVRDGVEIAPLGF